MDFDKILDEAAEAVAVKEADIDPRILGALGGAAVGGLGGYLTTDKERATKKRNKGKAAMRAIVGALLGGGIGAGGTALVQAMRKQSPKDVKYTETTSEPATKGTDPATIAMHKDLREKAENIQNMKILKPETKARLIDKMYRDAGVINPDAAGAGDIDISNATESAHGPMIEGVYKRLPGVTEGAGLRLGQEAAGILEAASAITGKPFSPVSVAALPLRAGDVTLAEKAITQGGDKAVLKALKDAQRGRESLRRLGGRMRADYVPNTYTDEFKALGAVRPNDVISVADKAKSVASLDKQINNLYQKAMKPGVAQSKLDALDSQINNLQAKKDQLVSWKDVENNLKKLKGPKRKDFEANLAKTHGSVAARDAKTRTRGLQTLAALYLTRDLQRDFAWKPLADMAYGDKAFMPEPGQPYERPLRTDIVNSLLNLPLIGYNRLSPEARKRWETF